LVLWSAAAGKVLVELKTSPDCYPGVIAFSPDGKYLASSGTDATGTPDGRVPIQVWDIRSGKLVSQSKSNAGIVYALAFSNDGTFLAAGDSDRNIQLYDTRKWEKTHLINANT